MLQGHPEDHFLGEGQIVERRCLRALVVARLLAGGVMRGHAGDLAVHDHAQRAAFENMPAQRRAAAREIIGRAAIDQLHHPDRRAVQPARLEDERRDDAVFLADQADAAQRAMGAQQVAFGQIAGHDFADMAAAKTERGKDGAAPEIERMKALCLQGAPGVRRGRGVEIGDMLLLGRHAPPARWNGCASWARHTSWRDWR